MADTFEEYIKSTLEEGMRWWVVALIVGLWTACSGGGGTGSEAKTDGTLYLQNVNQRMKVWVMVVSVNGQAPQEKDLPQGVSPQQEVEIPLDEITPVTAVLPGGAEVLIKFRIYRVRSKKFDLTVTIDGSQLLYLTDMNPYEEGLAALKYQLRPYR